MSRARKVLWSLMVFGLAGTITIAALGVPFGGAYVLPGCFLTFGAMGLIVTSGEADAD